MDSSNQNAAKIRILSLKEARALLALYEAMIETARTHNWDQLVEIERQAANLRDTAISRSFSSPEEEDVEELAALLTRIQRLDYEVRSFVEPACEHARQQLAVEVKGRTVRNAYGNSESPGG
ncbi:MAG: flagellar protein FliT [Betaproteobacteria bacterium]|nr:flagellar protein FliT [Betaproteobacteria bacterium]